ncbi:MAG TPA: hypothetical protein VGI03_10605 [Verrucomicrobiae bacterium]|jgi:hypothetical protein
MSKKQNYWLYFLLVLAVAAFGCKKQPKVTYHSSERVLALKLIPATPTENFRIKYLDDTNSEDGDIMPGYDGQFGNFQGNVSAITLFSNAATWRVELTFVGTISGSSMSQTNILNVPYPESRQLSLGQIGSVTGWYLSDEQLLDHKKMWQSAFGAPQPAP